MGLDMYWTGKIYIGGQFEHRGINYNMNITRIRNEKEVPVELPDDLPLEYVEYHLMYLRKANAIHSWIVDNCAGGTDECQPIYMDYDALEELHNTCRIVLENKDDPDKIIEILPTSSGFFFGGTEYDEWYFADVQAMYDFLDKLVKDDFAYLKKYDMDVIYYASW